MLAKRTKSYNILKVTNMMLGIQTLKATLFTFSCLHQERGKWERERSAEWLREGENVSPIPFHQFYGVEHFITLHPSQKIFITVKLICRVGIQEYLLNAWVNAEWMNPVDTQRHTGNLQLSRLNWAGYLAIVWRNNNNMLKQEAIGNLKL